MSMSSKIDWRALVELFKKATQKDEDKTVAYRFSNGREFYHEKDPYK